MRRWWVVPLAALVAGCGGTQDVRDLADLQAPGPVEGLTATPGDGRIRVNWRAHGSPDLIAYRVYRSLSEDSGYREVGASGRADFPYFEDLGPDPDGDGVPDGLTNGAEYFYRVTGLDKDGREGLFKLAPVARARPAVLPGTVKDLEVSQARAHVTADRVLVTWTLLTAADIHGYRVFRQRLGAAGDPEVVGDAGPYQGRYVDAAGSPSEDYRYAVAPVDHEGNVGRLRFTGVVREARTRAAVPLAPGHDLAAGALVRVPAGPEGGVWLEWGRPLQATDGRFFEFDPGGDPMIGGGYIVHRAEDPRGPFVPIAVLEEDGGEVLATYTDPVGRPEHTYMVRAFDRDGTLGLESRRVSGGARALPDLVRGVDAFAGVGARQVQVTWSPEDRATAGYRVYRSRRRERGYRPVGEVGPAATSFQDGSDVVIGETLWYRVAPLTDDPGGQLEGALSAPAPATPGPSGGAFYLEAEDATVVAGAASAADLGEVRRLALPRPWSARGALEVPYLATATPGSTTFTLRWVVDIVPGSDAARLTSHDVFLLVRRDDRAPTVDMVVEAVGSAFPGAAATGRLGAELFAERFGAVPEPTMVRVGDIAFESQAALGPMFEEVIELTVTLQTPDPLARPDLRLLIDGLLLVRR